MGSVHLHIWPSKNQDNQDAAPSLKMRAQRLRPSAHPADACVISTGRARPTTLSVRSTGPVE